MIVESRDRSYLQYHMIMVKKKAELHQAAKLCEQLGIGHKIQIRYFR